MKFIIAVIGLMLVNFSLADNYPYNIVIWDDLPEFYNALGNRLSTYQSGLMRMSVTQRRNLCSNTATAPIFQTSTGEIYQEFAELVSSRAIGTDVPFQIAEKTVLIGNTQRVETMLLYCELRNGLKFYLEHGRSPYTYFLYAYGDNNVPELLASIEVDLNFQADSEVFHEATDEYAEQREDRFCKSSMPVIMNICASVRRVVRGLTEESYTLGISYNENERSLCHRKILYPIHTEVKVVTCYMTSTAQYSDTELYFITPDLNENNLFLLEPSVPARGEENSEFVVSEHLIPNN